MADTLDEESQLGMKHYSFHQSFSLCPRALEDIKEHSRRLFVPLGGNNRSVSNVYRHSKEKEREREREREREGVRERGRERERESGRERERDGGRERETYRERERESDRESERG